MAKCKECFYDFHTCPNCGLVGWEWSFCSKKCFHEWCNPIIEDFWEAFPESKATNSELMHILSRAQEI